MQQTSRKPARTPPIPAEHIGLNIHTEPGSSTMLGILPRGAQIRIVERRKKGLWGKIEAIESGDILPPEVASYVREGADKGWVFLGKEHRHLLLKPIISLVQSDQVIVPATPIRINAGDLIGHLGQCWQSAHPTQEHRMVHIEVFCGSDLPDFLTTTRAAARHITDFNKLPLLRIDKGVKLFQVKETNAQGQPAYEEGADAPQTAVVQIYNQDALDAFPVDHKGPKDNGPGPGQPWWYVASANSRHEDISGWVRNRQMPPNGGVTRESPHAWSDFEPITGDDGGNPTICRTVDGYLDYVLDENKPATGDISQLKPLACNFYRALSPMRNEARAADELRALKDNKWLRFRASRLMLKHRSEWASQNEYESFFETVLKRIDEEPYHKAEIARVKQFVWWKEVAEKVGQPFPGSPEVFHIHPIALVGNFPSGKSCSCTSEFTEQQLRAIATHATSQLIQSYTIALNKSFADFEIKTCLQNIHFLAQILHESGEFQFTRELGGPKPYDPWRGRGLIQITLEENYKAYQNYIGQDFTSGSPARALLESPPHALLSAAWFFSVKHNLHKFSELDDFIWITRVINGGFNGYDDRLKHLNRAAEVLSIQPCFKWNQTGTYRLEDSRAFMEKKASFAWGLWSDPDSTKSGKTKSREQALIGYNRYLQLDIEAGSPVDAQGFPKDKGWYGIGSNVRVKNYVQARIQHLTNQI